MGKLFLCFLIILSVLSFTLGCSAKRKKDTTPKPGKQWTDKKTTGATRIQTSAKPAENPTTKTTKRPEEEAKPPPTAGPTATPIAQGARPPIEPPVIPIGHAIHNSARETTRNSTKQTTSGQTIETTKQATTTTIFGPIAGTTLNPTKEITINSMTGTLHETAAGITPNPLERIIIHSISEITPTLLAQKSTDWSWVYYVAAIVGGIAFLIIVWKICWRSKERISTQSTNMWTSRTSRRRSLLDTSEENYA